jgi:GH15 family glucan-1,4-alpha-glucosidase
MADELGIEDHGAIGNLHTVALVARDGAIDWLCLPELDAPSVFGALLDPARGGRFRLAPPGRRQLGEQRYLDATNVLETTFETPGGRVVVTDLMPLTGALDDPSQARTEPAVHRLVRAEGGASEVEVGWAPRFAYGERRTQVTRTDRGWLAWAGADALTLTGLGDDDEVRVEHDHVGPVLRATLRLAADEERPLVTAWGVEATDGRLATNRQLLDATVDAWRSWVRDGEAASQRTWAEPHRDLIQRSELVLKLLTHADSGAIAAAATTSLPEEIGGVRNWDYRYSWIRDAGLAAQALFALGHRAEAHAFIEWAERVAREEGRQEWGLQIVYGLHGETEIGERELPGLAGFRRSSPVRVGNGAVDQLQLDIYGELISAAYEAIRLGDDLSAEVIEFLPAVADEAAERWHDADYGLWELRNGPFEFVYSKVMVWMALDRADRLAERGVIEGDRERWREVRDAIREDVLSRGFDPDLGAFKQSYERAVLDASNLLLPLQEFLPVDDPRVQSTIDRTLADLTDRGLVHRYHADDGVAGGEGAFGLCTFWLVDALALSGRVDEATEIHEGMVRAANHLGLYSEQLDPADGTFLGNFPQAFSHLGLINSTLYLAAAQGRDVPLPSLIGSEAHRRG